MSTQADFVVPEQADRLPDEDASLAVLIVVKILALFTMIASSFIVRDIDLKLRRGSSRNEASTPSILSSRNEVSLTQSILFCLALGDFFSAFFTQFLSTWMVPSEVPVALASGSITTCTIQGFLSHLFYGISSCSTASLAVAYSGIVRFGWKDEIKGWRQLPFTGIPVFAGLVFAFVPIYGQNYNWNGGFACDVTGSPLGCDWPGSTTACTRGENALIMLGVTGIIPFVIAFSIIVASMALLVHSVLTQERKMDRYSLEGQPSSRRMTKKTTRQGMYYILAFGVGWIPYFIYIIVEYSVGRIPRLIFTFALITRPLQGVFNALVYFRPKYKAIKQNNSSESRISSVLQVLKIRETSNQKSNKTVKGAAIREIKESGNEEQKKEEHLDEE